MDKLFRWLVILALSLLTANVLTAEWPALKEWNQVIKLTTYETKSWAYAITNDWLHLDVEQKDIKIVLPKKKVVAKKQLPKRQWPMRIHASQTHSGWKQEMEAQKPYSTFEVQELIRKYATQHWVNVDLALRMSWCESWYRYWAKNKVSSAWWAFQFINWTWIGSSNKYWRAWESRFNADANIDVAIQKIKNEWTSAWNASKDCWGR